MGCSRSRQKFWLSSRKTRENVYGKPTGGITLDGRSSSSILRRSQLIHDLQATLAQVDRRWGLN